MTQAYSFAALKEIGMHNAKSALAQVQKRVHTRPDWSNENIGNTQKVIQDALAQPMLTAALQALYGPGTKPSDVPKTELRQICLNIKQVIRQVDTTINEEEYHG